MTPPAICKVSGYIYNLDGTPDVEAHIVVTVDSTAQDQGGQLSGAVGVTSTPIEVHTNDVGYFEFSALQGAKVRLEIPNINLRKLVAIPSAETALFSELV